MARRASVLAGHFPAEEDGDAALRPIRTSVAPLSITSRAFLRGPDAVLPYRLLPLEAAGAAEGARITWIAGKPAIWALALRNILYAKRVPTRYVEHPLGPEMGGAAGGQDALYRLTAQRSLPVLWWADERPRSVWSEQLLLADRVGRGPSLIPEDPAERVTMFGALNEVMGEDGVVANKRLLLAGDTPFGRKYGWTPAGAARAPRRVCSVLRLLASMLAAQERRGVDFLVGSRLSALDIYWATASIVVDPPGAGILPRTKENADSLRPGGRFAAANTPEIAAAFTPELRKHRDFILRGFCECPAVLGGTPL